MARQARFVLEDYPHHLVQRGNNSEHVFLDKDDYSRYLQLLEKYSREYRVKILAYCLMSNHTHILAVPSATDALAGMMRVVAGRYSRYFNIKYGRKGRLWESRFYSSVIEEDPYLWQVALYIEWNPVRAGIVEKPESWRYSSAKHHASGEGNPIITEALFDEADMKAYRILLKEGPNDEYVEEIRTCALGCRPVGSKGFLSRLAALFGVVSRGKPGRPKKAMQSSRKRSGPKNRNKRGHSRK